MMTTANELSRSAPAWAADADAVERFNDGTRDGHDLFRDGNLIGCCYDLGAGYEWIEGQSVADGDWDDTDIVIKAA